MAFKLSFRMITDPMVRFLNHESLGREFPMCDYERIRYELKPCDVVLVEGRSRVSEVIKLITQSPWSHAALYIGRIHDIENTELRELVASHYRGWSEDHLIIESQLGHGTVVRPLSYYKNEHLRICRPDGLTHKDGQEVVRFSAAHLGKDYDVRHVFDLFRLMFPWFIMPRQWRSTLFSHHAGRSTRTVCSTMIAEAFGSIQFPILPLVKKDGIQGVQVFRRNPKLCVPSDFDYSPYFQIIKYPFLDFNHQANYRLMPWSGPGELVGQEIRDYITPGSLQDIHRDSHIENQQDQLKHNLPLKGANKDSKQKKEDQPRDGKNPPINPVH